MTGLVSRIYPGGGGGGGGGGTVDSVTQACALTSGGSHFPTGGSNH